MKLQLLSFSEICKNYVFFFPKLCEKKKTADSTSLHFQKLLYYRCSLRQNCPYLEFFWSDFLSFGLNTKRYEVYLRIQSEYGKIRTRKTPNTDTLYAVAYIENYEQFNGKKLLNQTVETTNGKGFKIFIFHQLEFRLFGNLSGKSGYL